MVFMHLFSLFFLCFFLFFFHSQDLLNLFLLLSFELFFLFLLLFCPSVDLWSSSFFFLFCLIWIFKQSFFKGTFSTVFSRHKAKVFSNLILWLWQSYSKVINQIKLFLHLIFKQRIFIKMHELYFLYQFMLCLLNVEFLDFFLNILLVLRNCQLSTHKLIFVMMLSLI